MAATFKANNQYAHVSLRPAGGRAAGRAGRAACGGGQAGRRPPPSCTGTSARCPPTPSPPQASTSGADERLELPLPRCCAPRPHATAPPASPPPPAAPQVFASGTDELLELCKATHELCGALGLAGYKGTRPEVGGRGCTGWLGGAAPAGWVGSLGCEPPSGCHSDGRSSGCRAQGRLLMRRLLQPSSLAAAPRRPTRLVCSSLSPSRPPACSRGWAAATTGAATTTSSSRPAAA